MTSPCPSSSSPPRTPKLGLGWVWGAVSEPSSRRQAQWKFKAEWLVPSGREKRSPLAFSGGLNPITQTPDSALWCLWGLLFLKGRRLYLLPLSIATLPPPPLLPSLRSEVDDPLTSGTTGYMCPLQRPLRRGPLNDAQGPLPSHGERVSCSSPHAQRLLVVCAQPTVTELTMSE